MLVAVRPGRVRIRLCGGSAAVAVYTVQRADVDRPTWNCANGPKHVRWRQPGAAADGVLQAELLAAERRYPHEVPVPAGTRWLLIRQMDKNPDLGGLVVEQAAVEAEVKP